MKGCPHLTKVLSSTVKYPHIKPTIGKGWLCLKDGCVRADSNKQLTQIQKTDPEHKVFIHMATLQIYCIGCSMEIKDKQQQQLYELRKLAVESNPEQQQILYAGHKEYPPAFHKEKEGLCGLMGRQINSYVNAVIQLFAHVSPLYQIFQEIDTSKVHSYPLKLIIDLISRIRSGKFRVLETLELEEVLIREGSHFNFTEYVYEILKYMVEQLQFNGPQAKNKTIAPIPLQEQPPSTKHRVAYSPMHSLFSGSFHWQGVCSQCKHLQFSQSDFECIRLQCESLKKSQQISLNDLIDYTFDLRENNPFLHRKCEKCRAELMMDEKNSYMRLPNLLLLQFSSLDGIKVNLPPELDLTKYSREKANHTYKYVGCIGKHKKKYIAHVTHNQRQYIFDDAIIKDQGQKPTNVKVAIYKLPFLQKNKNIAKNVESSIEVNVRCSIPLPDFWNIYLGQLRSVDPLINPFICQHGYLRPQVESKCAKQRKVPSQIYQYLIEQYGGQKLLAKDEKDLCQSCQRRILLIREIKQSEREMAKFADRISNKKNKVCVDVQWLQKWKKYLYQESTTPYNNEGNRRPGPINNKKGLNEENEVIQEKYKKISPQVWYFLKKFYGGGPLIAKVVTQPSLAVIEAVDLRHQNIKHKIEYIY